MTKIEKKNIKNWFAIYVKPRTEKKTHHYLEQKGITSYCPLNKVKKQYSDRKKWVEEVLFPSYLFVQITETEKSEVRLTPGVLNFVYWNNKPAIIKEKDIINIRKFLKEYTDVYLERFETDDILIGQKIIIDSGMFMNQQAVVTKVKKDVVFVRLDSFRVSLVAEVSKQDIVKI